MGTQNIGLDTAYFPSRKRSVFTRNKLIVALSSFLLLSASFGIVFASTQIAPVANKHRIFTAHRTVPTATIQPYSEHTPVAPSPTDTPTPTPTPQPLSPFPLYLPQQIALLADHNRFFYGGNTTMPEVALTFDDGPNPPYTTQILAILQQYGVKASFFDVGRQVQAFPDVARQELAQGNIIGNHTWGHPDMTQLSVPSIIWQITSSADIIYRTTGVHPTFFRPPYGAISPPVMTYLNYFTVTTFLWNVDPRDWSRPGVNMIVNRVLAQATNGSIILMHDGGGDRSETVAALPIIISTLQQRGFKFVTLQQLVRDYQAGDSTISTNPLVTPESTPVRRGNPSIGYNAYQE